MASRQAKILSSTQIKATLSYLETSRNPERNRTIFLLSHKAGLRSCEIAKIKWHMVMDADGRLSDTIHLEDGISKKGGGGQLPIPKDLGAALQALFDLRQPVPADNIIYSERGRRMSAQSVTTMLWLLYRDLGFVGASSHSGRRFYITQIARKVSSVGGSMRECQLLARHSSLSVTQRYVDVNTSAARQVVELI